MILTFTIVIKKQKKWQKFTRGNKDSLMCFINFMFTCANRFVKALSTVNENDKQYNFILNPNELQLSPQVSILQTDLDLKLI